MTAKEKAKAKELVNSFRDYAYGYHDENETYNAKKCALICVDEIIEIQYGWCNTDGQPYKYWQEVKQEIEKL